MTQTVSHSPQVSQFITRLNTLEPGERARLKRDAGKSLSEASTLGLFYRLLPYGIRPGDEDIYFLVATLFPLADATERDDNFGATLRRARYDKNHKGLDRRLEVLLDADPTQLSFRLRQAIKFAKSRDAHVNWAQLLHDLLRWNGGTRSVQKAWARAYFDWSAEAPDESTPETQTN